MRNKTEQFINWLCGKDVPFPYCQPEDMPHIPDVYVRQRSFNCELVDSETKAEEEERDEEIEGSNIIGWPKNYEIQD